MTYHIVAFTNKQVADGILQEIMGVIMSSLGKGVEIEQQEKRVPRKKCTMEVLAAEGFLDREGFDRLARRLGGDPSSILFFNQCALDACKEFGFPLQPIATIQDDELDLPLVRFVDFPLYE